MNQNYYAYILRENKPKLRKSFGGGLTALSALNKYVDKHRAAGKQVCTTRGIRLAGVEDDN